LLIYSNKIGIAVLGEWIGGCYLGEMAKDVYATPSEKWSGYYMIMMPAAETDDDVQAQ
jgi:hypothetical protein